MKRNVLKKRTLRLEQLENRELLSATTWNDAAQADAALAAEMVATLNENASIDLPPPSPPRKLKRLRKPNRRFGALRPISTTAAKAPSVKSSKKPLRATKSASTRPWLATTATGRGNTSKLR